MTMWPPVPPVPLVPPVLPPMIPPAPLWAPPAHSEAEAEAEDRKEAKKPFSRRLRLWATCLRDPLRSFKAWS